MSHEIAQIDRAPEAGAADDHVADVAGFCEFAGGIDDDVFRAGLERPAGQRDVAGIQNAFEIRGLQAVRGEPFLRVIEIDLLGQDAGAIDARDFGRAEQRAREQVREVVELVIGVFVAWICGDELGDLIGVAHDDRRPSIGMQFGFVEFLFDESFSVSEKFRRRTYR